MGSLSTKHIEISSLDEHGYNICKILRDHSKQCYIVGGAVRDAMLGKTPSDIDFATDARPEEMKEIFENAGCKVYPTGEKYGTVTVTCDDINYYEITTFRGEKYRRGSRKPEIYFSKSIYEDLKRRDFTINAMAYDPIEKVLIDPFDGAKDLETRTIRAVDDAEERFAEDPLRMLRMCRFYSVIDGNIDSETFTQAKRMKDSLAWIPKERIRDELIKALEKSEKPSKFVECIVEARLNDYVVPELYDLVGLEQPPQHHMYDAYRHTLESVDNAKRTIVRLAALLHDIGKPKTKTIKNGRIMFPGHAEVSAEMSGKIMRRLRFPNKDIRDVKELVRYHMFLWSTGKTALENRKVRLRFLRALTDEGERTDRIDKLEELMRADAIAKGKDYEEDLELVSEFFSTLREDLKKYPVSRKQLAISGRDIVREFGVEGPIVGDTLEYLLNKVWERPEANNREDLKKIAYNYLKSRGALKKSF
ncbi:MAG: polynucleotide adenylyltransferase [Candidatus Nealsonbacteria bacterium]|nr:MAG: polynucleotide adenylyltransferase [Candidatus Nealsonbacteria bacterium]